MSATAASGNVTVAERRAEPRAASVSLQVFSTCPPSPQRPDGYLDQLRKVAEWSEKAGCTGILVYTDNSLIDPWLVSQILIDHTHTLCPLVAVQPVYMHPYTVAKNVSTLAFLHGRRVFLNMVAGGFKNDLAALGDRTPHDLRYRRLMEYTRIIQELLDAHAPVNFEGEFYCVKNAVLSPPLDPDYRPGFLMSGSSDAGRATAKQTGCVAIKYPEPPSQIQAAPSGEAEPCGVRIGIVARPTDAEAWSVALARFPEDRKGQITRQLANRVSDSEWHRRLAELSDQQTRPQGPYWLNPFENYHTNCPYLVGSHEAVGGEMARYIELGYRTVILDIPASEEEFEHIRIVLEIASRPKGSQEAGGDQPR
jgi:alkanesulfonate monooxygenase